MPETTPEMLAMARRVLAELEPNKVFAGKYRRGERDGIGTSIALAAIKAEREATISFLEAQSDVGADRGNESEKGTTRRAAFGGGSLALHRAATALRNGEHYHG